GLDRPVVRCIGHDVTERRCAEEALKESEQRFRQLAENMRDIVWIISADGQKVLFVNSAFEEVTGRTLESLYERQSSVDVIHPEDRERAVVGIYEQATGTRDADIEFRIVRPDGSLRWVRTRAFPLRNDRG